MASSFARFRDHFGDDLESQVARLTKEVSRLQRKAGKRGRHAYADATEGMSDLYEDIADRLVQSLPALRSGARRAESVARQNPAVVGLAGLALVGIAAALLYRR